LLGCIKLLIWANGREDKGAREDTGGREDKEEERTRRKRGHGRKRGQGEREDKERGRTGGAAERLCYRLKTREQRMPIGPCLKGKPMQQSRRPSPTPRPTDPVPRALSVASGDYTQGAGHRVSRACFRGVRLGSVGHVVPSGASTNTDFNLSISPSLSVTWVYPRLHYRLPTLCPAPTDPVGQSWPCVCIYVCKCARAYVRVRRCACTCTCTCTRACTHARTPG